MGKVSEAGQGTAMVGVTALYILLAVGDLYWIFLSIQMGSFAMFFIGVVPPCFLVAAPVVAYALLFGIPEWVINTFG